MYEEDLTDEQMDELQSMLLKLRGELTTTDAAQHEIEIRSRQVNAALSRIDTGDYGYCARCQESIGFDRLQETPERRFCIKCDPKRR